jgi:hypothetical protein
VVGGSLCSQSEDMLKLTIFSSYGPVIALAAMLAFILPSLTEAKAKPRETQAPPLFFSALLACRGVRVVRVVNFL